jgi:hypothetical protein
VNLKKEKILERLTKLEKDVEEIKDVIKVLYYISQPNKFTKTDCKGIFLKKNK